jgi:hypothetical protein
MIRFAFILKAAACVLGCLATVGCGSKPVGKLPDPTDSRLKTLGSAYALATDNLGHAPRSKEDLLQGLKTLKENLQAAAEDAEGEKADKAQVTWEPADILRSANDNEEFVVIYGVDYHDYNVSRTPRDLPVIAHEKTGKEGKRYVLQIRYVRLVPDEDFPNLKFPPGYRP